MVINSSRDCDANAVIRCGALSPEELNVRMGQSGVAAAYSCFGIADSDIATIEKTAVPGWVTKSGQVKIGNRVVASGAVTAGRQNMAGSTAIHCDGHTFYERPPRVSFASNSLTAFVVMDSAHHFRFAVIASCGNPVMATPVSTVVKKIKPTPPPVVLAQTQTQSQTVTVNSPPAVISPGPASQPVLPNTGPGNIVMIGAVSAIMATAGRYLYLYRRFN
jgi:hypothetical protein